MLALAIVLLLALPVGFYGMALYLEPKLPSVSEIKSAKLEMPLHLYSADNKLIGIYGNRMSLPVTFEEIPEDMVNALLAAEDSSYFEHSGISVKGLGRAITQLLTDDDEQTGGSTITMQVAKNYFLSSEQTFERKITELFLSRKIESELTKSEILTLYVNKIYLGEGSYGIKAAARKYFSKSLDNLTIEEFALLAAMPKAPSTFNPVVNPERALIRRNWILKRMHYHGYISQDEYDVAVTTPINLNLYADSIDTEMPYIAEMARYSLVQQFGKEVMNSGWRVLLTVDTKTQETANNIVRRHLLNYDRRRARWHGVVAAEGNLNNYKDFLNMYHAQVTSVGKSSFKAVLKSGEEIRITRSGMKWARGRLSKLLNENDIIRVSPHGNSWRVVQAPKVQGSLVSINPNSGSIIALVGGFHYNQSKFNRATHAYRQPGSTIKPLIYSAALEKGYTPSSMISDNPLRIGNWRPKNSDGRYYGAMELRRALYLSRNLVSIRLLRSVGTANALNLLEQFGLNKQELPSTLSLALGAGGATPLQMATSYATFANGGHRVQPYVIERIYGFDKELLYQANPKLACANCFNSILEELNKNQEMLADKMRLSDAEAIANAEEQSKQKLKEIVNLEEKLAALENQENAKGTSATDKDDNADSDKDKKDTDLVDVRDKQQDKESPSSKAEELRDELIETKSKEADATAKSDRLKAYPIQYARAEQATRILSPSVAYDMAGILRDVINIGTAKKARALGRSDIGGKTGTTNNFKDAWFAGFHPTNATVVWMGFDQPKSLGRGQFGGKLALPVWMDFMRTQLRNQPTQWVSISNHSKSTKDSKVENRNDSKTKKDQDKDKKATDKNTEEEQKSLIDTLPKAKVTQRVAPKPKPKLPTTINKSFNKKSAHVPAAPVENTIVDNQSSDVISVEDNNSNALSEKKKQQQKALNNLANYSSDSNNNATVIEKKVKPENLDLAAAGSTIITEEIEIENEVIVQPEVVSKPVYQPEPVAVYTVPTETALAAKPKADLKPQPKPQAFQPAAPDNAPQPTLKAFKPEAAPVRPEYSEAQEIDLNIQEVEEIPVFD